VISPGLTEKCKSNGKTEINWPIFIGWFLLKPLREDNQGTVLEQFEALVEIHHMQIPIESHGSQSRTGNSSRDVPGKMLDVRTIERE
jgi:hypothetical protein